MVTMPEHEKVLHARTLKGCDHARKARKFLLSKQIQMRQDSSASFDERAHRMCVSRHARLGRDRKSITS